jgi:hypothetical protein
MLCLAEAVLRNSRYFCIPNKHMMTINFDTITNNYEVIYVIKTVMKYHLKKNRYEFSSYLEILKDEFKFLTGP